MTYNINMEKLYSTGEFAKIAGVTIRTIRYYDKIGLLKCQQKYSIMVIDDIVITI